MTEFAKVVINALGGDNLISTYGAKEFVFDEYTLSFRVPRIFTNDVIDKFRFTKIENQFQLTVFSKTNKIVRNTELLDMEFLLGTFEETFERHLDTSFKE